ncbi:S-adenosyl-L-methionine-dependent methyltransferase [Diplogelasinospora grovesii]|uniref:S-adenosyl-L-methionine-dependent methyltransferase n=1 Tax=Diplogelasinospora grovesii TaxID=303347 RepID=A0AAN6NIM5_9PEZI|nr:S-adenosyl-L-methionine-dependent methyltransferase [Diplogelasinospora grovesii]
MHDCPLFTRQRHAMEEATADVPLDLKSRLKESYDAIAPVHNAWTAQHASLRIAYLDKLIHLLSTAPRDKAEPLQVLELGCGAGIPVTEKLLSGPNGLTFHVTANDLSSAQLALAKERIPDDGVIWVEGDMMDLKFAEHSFDVILGFYSLIHLPREEQELLLERIARWLKPGGYMLANFSAEAMAGVVMSKWLHQEKGWMYWSGWGAEVSLEKVRAVGGLEVVLGEVSAEDGVDASFLWVIARAPQQDDAGGGGLAEGI